MNRKKIFKTEEEFLDLDEPSLDTTKSFVDQETRLSQKQVTHEKSLIPEDNIQDVTIKEENVEDASQSK